MNQIDLVAFDGRSRRLTEAVSHLWATMADDYGLFPELSLDAVFARADRGELAAAVPRMLTLLVTGSIGTLPTASANSDPDRLGHGDAAAIVARCGADPGSRQQRAAIEETLDAWWEETINRPPDEQYDGFRPTDVLGVLCGYGAPLGRWLDPWLMALDGPAAVHMASMIVDGSDCLTGPAWDGKEDQAGQVLGWTRTEAVINGITLIGGVHLDAGMLSKVLDQLI